MDRRGFRCFIIKNLSRGCLPSAVYAGPLLEGRELEPNAAVREDKDVAGVPVILIPANVNTGTGSVGRARAVGNI